MSRVGVTAPGGDYFQAASHAELAGSARGRVNDRRIDIHPAVDDEASGYWQHGLDGDRYTTPADSIATGVIGGRPVHCFTVEKQLETHQGDGPTATDLADIERLRGLASQTRPA